MKRYKKYRDDELLSLLSLHDEAAFTELYNRYWQKLLAIAFNRLKDSQSAEDIVHDVFAALWSGRNSIKIESLENYLAVAVKYAVFNKIRKKAKERAYQRAMQDTAAIGVPAETSIDYKQLLAMVKVEVERLPEKCRLVFKYSRNNGMPIKAIAAELKISPKTVENQMGKAIRHLRVVAKSLLQSSVFFFFF